MTHGTFLDKIVFPPHELLYQSHSQLCTSSQTALAFNSALSMGLDQLSDVPLLSPQKVTIKKTKWKQNQSKTTKA